MKRGIFRRVFVSYAVVFVLAVLFVEVYVTATVRKNYQDTLRENLSIQIDLIAKGISFKEANLDDFCIRMKQDIGARVTVIAEDGRVLGDSDTAAGLMDNHRHRTEIEQSLLLDTGMTVRHSDTLKSDFLYIAKKISHAKGTKGFVRLAVPLKEVDKSVNLLRMKIILVIIGVLLATSLVSLGQTEHLRRLLRQITDFSKTLSRGEIDKRLYLKNAGEFNEIAENITTMSVKLQDMIARNEEERSRLSVILKSIPDALLIIDARGKIVLSSASAREFFGDVTGTGVQFMEALRSNETADLVEHVRKTLLPGMTKFRIDVPGEKYLAVRVSPLFYRENELSGFVVVFHDITQIERLEQVRRDFVANVSHELKTPITAIRGFADTLLDGAMDDKENAARFVRTIKSNSERINSLVDDLMTISKIELGVIRVEKTAVELSDVFSNVLELFKEKAAEKNLSLSMSNRPGIGQINADRNRLIQVLTNLVDNAIKFTESGGVTFGIDQDGGKTFIFVEDTGIGVPQMHLPRLGERFYRVDPARSRKMGGTGLGLAIVKHLVKAHGWQIRIESSEGKGAKIIIVIPEDQIKF